MEKTTTTKTSLLVRMLNLNPWKQALLFILALVLLPLTLMLILWYLYRDNINIDTSFAKSQKKSVEKKTKEARAKIENLKEENTKLKERRAEILKEVEERDEKASRIAADIPSANNLEKLERIRQRINRLK